MPRQPAHRLLAGLSATLLIAAGAVLPGTAASADGGHRRHVVRPGQSIQAAITAARPGDTVLVRPGTYRENLQIDKSDITLVGFGATLEAAETPTIPTTNCVPGAPNRSGICVSGPLDPTTGQRIPVRNVTIRGLTIGDFPESAILVVAAKHTRLERVDAAGGADYGVLFLQSSDSTLVNSTLHGGQVAGLYIGESPDARVTVTDNRIFDNGIFGIFIRNASRGVITRNRVQDSCIGVGFIPTTQDENAVRYWRASRNLVTANNQLCNTGGGALTGIGFYVAGAKNITISKNAILNNTGTAGANPEFGGGVVVDDGSLFGSPSQPAGNRVNHNKILGNLPNDITVVVPGTDNEFSRNRCRTSSPSGLC